MAGDHGDGDVPEIELIPVEATERPRRVSRRGPGRFLILGVAAALVGGLLLTANEREEPSPEPDGEEDAFLPQPVALTPLGPRDGKASIGLPVTVEPEVGLEDGSRVTATGSGFRPGEQVAIIQCALEAGRPAKGGEAAGIDGCDTGFVNYANASSDGIATGDYAVRKTMTTSVTGEIDCSARPGRCIVAMAAMSDYDRSGGDALTFGPAPVPDPASPTLTVVPAIELTDVEVVHVEATGLPASSEIKLEVCSVDPAACWSTGRNDNPTAQLVTDENGALAADVPVWRYLPGPQPRTYIDCAVSVCDLVLTTGTPGADPPVADLAFSAGGEGPVGAALTLEPSEEVQPGSSVIVRGAGFDPTTTVTLSLCITGDAGDQPDGLCVGLGDAFQPEDDGTFEVTVTVPGVEALGGDQLADPSPTSTTAPDLGTHPCDGASTRCVVRASLAYGSAQGGPLRPRFGPEAVPITYAAPG